MWLRPEIVGPYAWISIWLCLIHELKYVTEGMWANSGNVTLAKHGMAKLPMKGFVHSENVIFSVPHEVKTAHINQLTS